MNEEVAALVVWLAAVAVVAFSVPAKALDRRTTTLAWPIAGPRLRRLLGPTPVLLAEALLLGFALVPVPSRPRFLALGVLYAAYAVASAVLRGRPCACFGRTLATRFGWVHAGVCAAAAVALFVAGSVAPPAATDATVVAALGVAGGAGSAVTAWWLRRRTQRRVTDPARIPRIRHVVVFGSTGCPGCRGVWAQREQLTAIAAIPVEFRLLTEGDSAAQAGGAIPAAIGYDSADQAVYGPVVGLTAIRGLLAATQRTGSAPTRAVVTPARL